MKQRGKSKSIFRTILFSVLAVLIIEIVLPVSALNLSRVGPELDNNAVEILKKQVENRQNYLEALMQENQKLSDLSDKIDETFLELEEKGKIQLETLAESSKNSLPLLSAVSEDLISAMRSKNITGIFQHFKYPGSGNMQKRLLPSWNLPAGSGAGSSGFPEEFRPSAGALPH